MKRTALLLSLLVAALLVASANAATVDVGIHTLSFGITEAIELLGTADFTFVDGGSTQGYVDVRENATLTMLGGRIEGFLAAAGDEIITIKGGTIGGDIKMDSPSSQGDVYIYGTNFAIDGVPVEPGTYHQTGTYTATLENGEQLNNQITFTRGNDVILIPEPATLGLLTFGIVMLRRKKRFIA